MIKNITKTIIQKTLVATSKTYRFFDKCEPLIGFMVWVIAWIFVLYLLLPVFASMFRNMYKTDLSMSDFILLITAGFLIATLYETKRTNDQERRRAIRPILLRTGFLNDWESLQFTFDPTGKLMEKPIEFKVMKNIATTITGHVIISGKKYKLLFSHEITKDGGKMTFLES